MTNTLIDLNLQHLPDKPFVGTWRVETAALHRVAPAEPLVTRPQRSPVGHYQALALYFQSGPELLLVQP